MTDHTWENPVGMFGRFSLDGGEVLQFNVFADGEENIVPVGRLCFLSRLHGHGAKIRVQRALIEHRGRNVED